MWSTRADQPAWMVRALTEALAGSASLGPEASEVPKEIIQIVEETGPIERSWQGIAYSAPRITGGGTRGVRLGSGDADLVEEYLAEWVPDLDLGQPFYASLEAGVAVSVCCSVRVTVEAHEAGVETHPDFRGQERAAAVVAGWAEAVRGLDAIPLYSTSVDNTASRRVAEKLGLTRFGTDFHLT